jgi:FkbM family methyltransferase
MITPYLNISIEIDDLCPIYRGSFGLNGELAEPDIIVKLADLIKQSKPILLDVGACTGSYALLDKVANVEIHSFEPVKKTYAVLCKNIESNESKTKAYNCAVSNYDGFGTLKTVPYDGAIALSLVDGRPSFTRKDTKSSQVRVITVDCFCKDKNIIPDFIKIDVEGGELRVLQGAKTIIKKHKPIILCEFSQENANQFGYHIQDIINLLQGIYNIERLRDNILCTPK